MFSQYLRFGFGVKQVLLVAAVALGCVANPVAAQPVVSSMTQAATISNDNYYRAGGVAGTISLQGSGFTTGLGTNKLNMYSVNTSTGVIGGITTSLAAPAVSTTACTLTPPAAVLGTAATSGSYILNVFNSNGTPAPTLQYGKNVWSVFPTDAWTITTPVAGTAQAGTITITGTGTITTLTTSPTVTGVGTNFNTAYNGAGLPVGTLIFQANGTTLIGVVGVVPITPTSLTLASNAATAVSGTAYTTPQLVTGTGTSFTTSLQVGSQLYNSTGASAIGTVASIVSNTKLTLTANPATAITTASGYMLSSQGGGVGTITTLATSPTVTGIGTSFTTQLAPGSVIYNQAGTTLIGTVLSIQSDTSLTLTANANTPVLAGTGTILTFNNQATVTGTSTTFTTQLAPGKALFVGGVFLGTVLSITDNTHLTLTSNAATTNNPSIAYSYSTAYVLLPTFSFTATTNSGTSTLPAQPLNVTVANLQTALQALPAYGTNNVLVTGTAANLGTAGSFTVTAIGTLAGTPTTIAGLPAGYTAVHTNVGTGPLPGVPTVTALSVGSGSPSGGTILTITGTNFPPSNQFGASVYFGNNQGTVTSVNAAGTQMTVTDVLGGTIGTTVDVRVGTVAGISPINSPSDSFSYASISLGTTTGPIGGGTAPMTITANGFGTSFLTTAPTVTWAGNALACTVTGANTVTVIAPIAATAATTSAGVTLTQVTASTLSSSATYTYTAPAIAFAAPIPPLGAPAGATPFSITVTGAGPFFAAGTANATVNFITAGTATSNTVLASGNATDATAVWTVSGSSPAGSLGGVNVSVTQGAATTGTATWTYGTSIVLSPLSGSLAGTATNQLTITANGFTFPGDTTITFGAWGAGTNVVVAGGGGSLTVNPPTATTAGAIALTANSVSQGALGTTTYTYNDIPPAVTSLSAFFGSMVGGVAGSVNNNTVTISGSGFTGATGPAGVTFGAVNATSYTVVNDTTITATVPPSTALATTPVAVVVTTPQGSSSSTATTNVNKFTYTAPSITQKLNPSAGAIAGGTTITITGVGFTGATLPSTVQFGPTTTATVWGATPSATVTNALSFTVVNDTTITAVAPAHVSGNVSVTVNVGAMTAFAPVDTSVATSAGQNPTAFDYTTTTVSSVSPSGGPAAGGSTVTITGTNFTAGAAATATSNLLPVTQVNFGGVALTPTANNPPGPGQFVIVSATSIVASVPAGVSGTSVDLQVVSPQLGSSALTGIGQKYVYVPVGGPAVTSVTPTYGLTALTPITFTWNTAGTSDQSSVNVTFPTGINTWSVVGMSPANNMGIVPGQYAYNNWMSPAAGTFTISSVDYNAGTFTWVGGTTLTGQTNYYCDVSTFLLYNGTATNTSGQPYVSFPAWIGGGSQPGGAPSSVFAANALTATTTTTLPSFPAGFAPPGSVLDVVISQNGMLSTPSAASKFTIPATISQITSPVTSNNPTGSPVGPLGGGTTVVITGQGFTSPAFSGVSFGGTALTTVGYPALGTYIVNSPTQITAISPAVAVGGPVNISVNLSVNAQTIPSQASTPPEFVYQFLDNYYTWTSLSWSTPGTASFSWNSQTVPAVFPASQSPSGTTSNFFTWYAPAQTYAVSQTTGVYTGLTYGTSIPTKITASTGTNGQVISLPQTPAATVPTNTGMGAGSQFASAASFGGGNILSGDWKDFSTGNLSYEGSTDPNAPWTNPVFWLYYNAAFGVDPTNPKSGPTYTLNATTTTTSTFSNPQYLLTGGGDPNLGLTNYLANSGMYYFNIDPNNTANAKYSNGPFFKDSKTKLTEISDGTSNTIAFGEALGGAENAPPQLAFTWMGAGTMPSFYDCQTPAQYFMFSSQHPGFVNFAFCDGSVRAVTKTPAASPVDTYHTPPAASNPATPRWIAFQLLAGINDNAAPDFTQLGLGGP